MLIPHATREGLERMLSVTFNVSSIRFLFQHTHSQTTVPQDNARTDLTLIRKHGASCSKPTCGRNGFHKTVQPGDRRLSVTDHMKFAFGQMLFLIQSFAFLCRLGWSSF